MGDGSLKEIEMKPYDYIAREALKRMGRALQAGKGVRLTNDELWHIDKTFIGEIMAGLVFDDAKPKKRDE
jgi:hypothetical protein